jgi:hypothetical protein
VLKAYKVLCVLGYQNAVKGVILESDRVDSKTHLDYYLIGKYD